LADCHHALEEAWWIYLVRSLGFQPEPSSHDWHVQPICQRTDPLPPERALSVQSRSMITRASRVYTNLPVLETCTNYAFAAPTVNPLLAQDIHLFSTTGEASRLLSEARKRNRKEEPSARDETHLPHTPMPFRHKPRRKSSSLKKDHLEVSANNAFNPSRNLVPE
jgi:hypothetical protein